MHRVLMGKPEGKRSLGDRDLDGWIILKLILGRWDVILEIGWLLLKIGTNGGLM